MRQSNANETLIAKMHLKPHAKWRTYQNYRAISENLIIRHFQVQFGAQITVRNFIRGEFSFSAKALVAQKVLIQS